jgi:RHS repeat-associated protein
MSHACVLGFTGAYMDPVTRWYPLGNGYRFYFPTLFRFNAPDGLSPFGGGGANPYVYSAADPINRSDPSGHISVNIRTGEAATFQGLHALLHDDGLLENTLRDAESGESIGASDSVAADDRAHPSALMSATESSRKRRMSDLSEAGRSKRARPAPWETTGGGPGRMSSRTGNPTRTRNPTWPTLMEQRFRRWSRLLAGRTMIEQADSTIELWGASADWRAFLFDAYEFSNRIEPALRMIPMAQPFRRHVQHAIDELLDRGEALTDRLGGLEQFFPRSEWRQFRNTVPASVESLLLVAEDLSNVLDNDFRLPPN